MIKDRNAALRREGRGMMKVENQKSASKTPADYSWGVKAKGASEPKAVKHAPAKESRAGTRGHGIAQRGVRERGSKD